MLIITEFIGTGKTLESLVMNFRAKGIPCDVATIGAEKNIFQRFRFGRRMGSKIIRGQKETPKYLRSRKGEITGVIKDYEHLFSESFRAADYEADEEIQSIVHETREDAKKLTLELVKWYCDKYK